MILTEVEAGRWRPEMVADFQRWFEKVTRDQTSAACASGVLPALRPVLWEAYVLGALSEVRRAAEWTSVLKEHGGGDYKRWREKSAMEARKDI